MTDEQPFLVAAFEIGVETSAGVAVAAEWLKAVEIADAVDRCGEGDELDLALAGGPGQVDGPLEHVAKLANVPRPVVRGQGRDGVVGHRERPEGGVVLRALLQKEVHEPADVLASAAKRGHDDGHDRETKVEILAELAAFDLSLQVPLGAWDD